MGLFGGFKAKFTKDSTAKSSKSDKKNEVVCLGYRVYSEFDNPPQYLQTQPQTSKQPPAIRTRTPASSLNPAANSGEFNAPAPSTSTQIETQIVPNPKLKKSSKKKAPETEEKHVSTTKIETQIVPSPKLKKSSKKKALETGKKPGSTSTASLTITNTSDESWDTAPLNRETSISSPNINNPLITSESVRLRNGGVKNESRSAPNSVYVRGKTSSFNPNQNEISSSNSAEVVTQEVPTKAPKSILKQKPAVYSDELSSQVSNSTSDPNGNTILTSEENIYSDSDYDRSLTLQSSKTKKSGGYTTETVDYMSAKQAVTKSSSAQVATYVHTEVSSSITKPTVNDNSNSYYNNSGGYASYNTTTRSIGSTSNHAASIFFGGDEEPEQVQRPRRNNLVVAQNEEERRSSVEC